MTGSNEVGSGF